MPPPRPQDRAGQKRRQATHIRGGGLQKRSSSGGGAHRAATADVSLLPFMKYMLSSSSAGTGSEGKKNPSFRGRGRGSARGRAGFNTFTAQSSTSESDSDGSSCTSTSADSAEPIQPSHIHRATSGLEEGSLEVVEEGEEDMVSFQHEDKQLSFIRPRGRRAQTKRLRSTDSFYDEGLNTDDDMGPSFVRSSTEKWCEETTDQGLIFTATTTTTTTYQIDADDDDEDDVDYEDSELSEMVERCMSISSSDDRYLSTSTTTSSGRRVIRGVTLTSSSPPEFGDFHPPGVLTSSHHTPTTMASSPAEAAHSTDGIESLDSSFMMTEWNMSTPRSQITVTKRRSNSQGRLTPLTPIICPRRPRSASSTPLFKPSSSSSSPSSFFMSHASMKIDIASTIRSQQLGSGTVGRPKRAREDSARRAHVAVPKEQEKQTVRRMQADKATKHLIRSLRPKRDDFNMHVVLDLDETLVYARSGTILVRPYVSHLIGVLARCNCEIILWTAGIPLYVEGILEALDMVCDIPSTTLAPSRRWYHHLITRSSKWFDECSPGVKDLRRLGRRLDRTIIIENNPASVQLQPDNAILVQDYVTEDYQDISLKYVAELIERCVETVRSSATGGPAATSTPPLKILQSAPELCEVSFSLAAEHCCSNVPSKISTKGLQYVPPKSRKGLRCYAGEAPI